MLLILSAAAAAGPTAVAGLAFFRSDYDLLCLVGEDEFRDGLLEAVAMAAAGALVYQVALTALVLHLWRRHSLRQKFAAGVGAATLTATVVFSVTAYQDRLAVHMRECRPPPTGLDSPAA